MAGLFMFGLVNNLSMSYMGNTSQAVVDFIFQNFLGFIILFIMKVLGIYIMIGLLLGYVIHAALRGLQVLTGKALSTWKSFAITAGTAFIVALIVFFRDLVLYPQIYINNFYVKGRALAAFFDLLTGSTVPAAYTAVLAFLALCCLRADHRRLRQGGALPVCRHFHRGDGMRGPGVDALPEVPVSFGADFCAP